MFMGFWIIVLLMFVDCFGYDQQEIVFFVFVGVGGVLVVLFVGCVVDCGFLWVVIIIVGFGVVIIFVFFDYFVYVGVIVVLMIVVVLFDVCVQLNQVISQCIIYVLLEEECGWINFVYIIVIFVGGLIMLVIGFVFYVYFGWLVIVVVGFLLMLLIVIVELLNWFVWRKVVEVL